MDFEVIKQSHSYVTEQGSRDDEWDRDNTAEEHYIEGVAISSNRRFQTVDGTVSFDLVPEKTYFLLYGIYSTGDSFGYDEGRIDFIDLYESLSFAVEMRDRVEAHATTDGVKYKWDDASQYYVTLLSEKTGKEYKYAVPWNGCFERLSYLEIQEVRLIEKDD